MTNEFVLLPICKLLDYVLPKSKKAGMPVFIYHSISNNDSRLSISPKVFERQINYLKKEGYQSITPLQLKEIHKKKPAIITFDDGYKDNYTEALPILKKYGFVATVFISTDYIGGKSRYCRKESDRNFFMLNEQEIKDLNSEGWCIANHFASHRDLDILSDEEIIEEYLRAKKRLREIIGENDSLSVVAFPHGRFNDKAVRALKEQGIKMATDGAKRLYNAKADSFFIPRIEIIKQVSYTKFKIYLSPSFYLIRSFFKNERVKR